MIEFYENNDTNHEDFKEAMEIYKESFPSNERHAANTIKERVEKGLSRLFVGRMNEKIVFMALFWPLRDTNFVLFDYMAVKENYRNKGIGTEFVKNIYNTLENKDVCYILEVENPNYGNNKEQRARRVNFYKRLGAKEMKDVKYILPPLSGTTYEEMILMVLSRHENKKISGKLVKKIIIQIYKDLYGRNEDDLLVKSFIHNIPSNVELINSHEAK